jgi:phosphatidate cytidylyltransferase
MSAADPAPDSGAGPHVRQPPDPPDRPRSVVAAVGAGLALGALVIATLLLGRAAFFGLILGAVLIAQAELYAVLRKAGHAPVTLLGLACGAVVMVLAYERGAPGLALGTALPLPLLLVWGLTTSAERVKKTISSTYLGVVYGPVLVGFGILLLRGRDGLVLTATVIGMAAINDSGGYLVGRKLGRHPMAPKTSPKKSWEGFIAGTVITLGLSVAVLPFIHPFTALLALRLAAVVAVAAPMGDLAESLLKRDLGVKDMGSIIPGHGGFMDRIDGIIFSIPIAYYVLRVLKWA